MIDYDTGMPQWPPTFDQEGNAVTQQMVMQEGLAEFTEILEEKRAEFEEALDAKCRKVDEVYRKMGFEPRAGMIVYQVGMGIYGLRATSDGIQPIQVGRIG